MKKLLRHVPMPIVFPMLLCAAFLWGVWYISTHHPPPSVVRWEYQKSDKCDYRTEWCALNGGGERMMRFTCKGTDAIFENMDGVTSTKDSMMCR